MTQPLGDETAQRDAHDAREHRHQPELVGDAGRELVFGVVREQYPLMLLELHRNNSMCCPVANFYPTEHRWRRCKQHGSHSCSLQANKRQQFQFKLAPNHQSFSRTENSPVEVVLVAAGHEFEAHVDELRSPPGQSASDEGHASEARR